MCKQVKQIMMDCLEACGHEGVVIQSATDMHEEVLGLENHYSGFFYFLRQAQSINISITQLCSNIWGG